MNYQEYTTPEKKSEHLNLEERKIIKRLIDDKCSNRAIARLLKSECKI